MNMLVSICLAGLAIFSVCIDALSQGQCYVDIGDYNIINLKSLENRQNKPSFQDIKCTTDGMLYSYSPCESFDEGDCRGAAVCRIKPDYSQFTSIGQAGSSKHQYDSSTQTLTVAYITQVEPIRVTEVILICDITACWPEFTPLGPDASGSFHMQLKSVCACPGMCTDSGPVGDCAQSGGSRIRPGLASLLALMTVLTWSVQ